MSQSWFTRYWDSMNKNVRLILAFTLLWVFSRGLWQTTQLSAFIFFFADKSNTTVGIVSSVAGITQLLAAIPAGILADRSRRDILLRLSTSFGLLAICITLIAVINEDLFLLYIAMVLWGLVFAFNDAPIEALFADSTETGRRAHIFAVKHTTLQIGRSASALAAALIFVFVGNQWTIPVLKVVIVTGLAITTFPMILLCFLNDDHSLDASVSGAASDLLLDRRQEDEREERILSMVLPRHSSLPMTVDRMHSRLLSLPINRLPSFRTVDGPDPTQSSLAYAPYVVATTDLLTALGSGALLQFYPIFFLEVYGIDPLTVSLLFAFTPLMTGAASMFAQDVASTFGRAKVTLILHLCGAFLLFMFGQSTSAMASALLFVLMTAVMNSIKPLKRSILMDVVKKENRGIWNAAEGFAKSSWAGSSALGGLMIDAIGYRPAFISVACLYVVSSIPVYILLRMDIDSIVAEVCDVDEDDENGNDRPALSFVAEEIDSIYDVVPAITRPPDELIVDEAKSAE